MKYFAALPALALLAFGGWHGWRHLEAEKALESSVSIVAPLVEYRELYANGRDREANDILLKTVAALVRAENAGVDLGEVLRRAERVNNTPVNYSDLLTESLLRNVKIARELELDTPENLARMSEGTSPVVGRGPYAGEKAEVDHIVPRSLAPDLDNLLINLELMPRTLNRRKSKKVTQRAEQMAKRFFDAGVMRAESYEVVIECAVAK
jgi:hypothetical protein